MRNLVSFVRKRDKRVQAYKKVLEERAALNRQKQEQNRLEQIRRRQQEVEEMRQNSKIATAHNDDYEEQLKQLEQQYSSDEEYYDDEDEDDVDNVEEDGEVEGDFHDDMAASGEEDFDEYEDDEDDINDLYCVACNKEFKTEKAFANHQTSKKHQDNVEKLKREMLAEENSYKNETVEEEACVKPEQENNSEQAIETEEDNISHEIATKTKRSKSKNKKEAKKGKKPIVLHTETETEEQEILNNVTKNTSKLDLFENENKDSDNDDDDWNTSNKKTNKKSKTKNKANKNKSSALNETPLVQKPIEAKTETIKFAKSTSDVENEVTEHICATCKSKFESKNKLFIHLKLTNHGVYIPKAKSSNDESKSKKSKGKRK